jgi:hypothetical protein
LLLPRIRVLETSPSPEKVVRDAVLGTFRVRQQSLRNMLNLVIPSASSSVLGATVVDVNVAA